jgi:formamidopyrimidine-DNA glycosylase
MPELPEVETTVRQIKKVARSLTITDVWTDYGSPFHNGKPNIKDGPFFEKFRKVVIGRKIIDTSRRGKHVLIHLSGGVTILAHMKMSGHFLYGKYKRHVHTWIPDEKSETLHDPYNRFIHLVFSLSNGKHLAFSDLRKFAKVTFFHDKDRESVADLSTIGPEPLAKGFSLELFTERLALRPVGKIKQVLMDQSIIAGIGNIYSDEMLFSAGVHPEERVMDIPKDKLKKMHGAMKKILKYSISIGGDSASDFRDLEGKRGGFQNKHKAYRRTGQKCLKQGCSGRILRRVVGGRSAHFCDRHQRLSKKYASI